MGVMIYFTCSSKAACSFKWILEKVIGSWRHNTYQWILQVSSLYLNVILGINTYREGRPWPGRGSPHSDLSFCFPAAMLWAILFCHALLPWSQTTMGYKLRTKINLSSFKLCMPGTNSQQWKVLKWIKVVINNFFNNMFIYLLSLHKDPIKNMLLKKNIMQNMIDAE